MILTIVYVILITIILSILDIDECKEVPNPCGTASCTNNLGGYSCEPGIHKNSILRCKY